MAFEMNNTGRSRSALEVLVITSVGEEQIASDDDVASANADPQGGAAPAGEDAGENADGAGSDADTSSGQGE